jgi:RNA polymerase sigma-70 factor (ECF subfamily)
LGLLARVKAQEHGSWEQLVALYTPLVYRWCRQRQLPEVDAEDVGQEVFRAVFRKIGDFRRDQAGQSFRAWLHTITARKIIDHRKRGNQAPAVGGSDARKQLEEVPAVDARDSSDASENDHGSEMGAADERRILLRQALKQLERAFKPVTWQAFWQVDIEGRPPAVVAHELGITPNAVYLAKSRVRKRLREEFAELVEPEPAS